MSTFLKSKTTAVGLMFLVGFITIFELFFPVIPGLTPTVSYLTAWIPVLINLTALVGTLSLIMRNINSVRVKEKNYWLSAWTLLLMAVVYGVYLTTGTTTSAAYSWLFENIYANISSATMGLLGYYILLSAARAFRARNLEVAVLIFAAIFVLLTNATVGAAISPVVPQIGTWLLNVPGFGTNRGMLIAGGIGVIVMGLRILIGDEKSILG